MRRFIATGLGMAGFVVTGLLFHSSIGRAQQVTDPETQTKILKGFQIAPVPLNMTGLDPNLVGYGSYVVNTGGCNDCHSAGPQTQYLPTGNPFFGVPQVTNPATYLGGGRDFGAFPDPAGPFPHIISRNLTPDKTGLAEGGNSLSQFMQIMRTGVDFDQMHPTCSGPPNGSCLPAPFNGALLQIMPWPGFQSLTDHDLQSIYAYLTAIPCVEGGPGEPPKRCPAVVVTPPPTAATVAVANPKNVTVITRQVQLDGTKSTSADGKPLTYLWTLPQGSLPAGIIQATTATPTVQFGSARGLYTFLLTVTDSTGKSATDTASVNFVGN
jgi:hypothetical protein